MERYCGKGVMTCKIVIVFSFLTLVVGAFSSISDLLSMFLF